MKTKKKELFKYFTLADERNDIHTSASAMMRDFVEQMDLESIKLMLSDIQSLADFDTATFITQLEHTFNTMRWAGNTLLESAEGKCNRCHPGTATFTFKGKEVPLHFSLLFHEKENKVVDIGECSGIWVLFPELAGDMQHPFGDSQTTVPDPDWYSDDAPF
jgi:hypothetical protein